ncbi:MAG: ABC transporter ATP-binding protein [Clostridia bacterium]|nr:ABC transporter ATP-binding protein [Clostridia bacterium]
MELTVCIRKAAYRRRTVLENVNFTLADGTFTAVIGRNGSGKSTLISCIAGLLPYDGEILADGVNLEKLTGRERALRISVMLQQPRTPHVTVEELISFGRVPHHPMGRGKLTAEDREAIESAVRESELESMRERYADTLSGGEQRRAHFAANLAQNAPVMLLDESTAFMDAENEARYLEKTASLRGRKTILAVLHDLGAAVRYSDRILLLDGGTVRFLSTPEEFLGTFLPEDVFHVKRYEAADEDGKRVLFFR